ncbi:hypothetical protein IW261DRAFT_1577187 [Armillaria novae-zelandiae]|uniref:Uncharacterized protein n=1 Tax=Armillaria novae-zelandiae TaxID=153914 RepID=A0AA39N9G1_9AGAR|nr:hypothetical protein IW261DRAFT_1577187 [Armillaria novae-zelandiae]
MNEDDTTSSSRIFVKILMNEMMESMGLKTLAERFKDPEVRHACQGMFPVDVPKNTRFAINYFTSIGLGVITEDMREYLKNAPKAHHGATSGHARSRFLRFGFVRLRLRFFGLI